MIRATTGGVMRSYRSNLMNSFINMNANRNTVLSQRTFNSYAENPASAARAFRLRKSRMMVEGQHEICADTMKKYESAVACLQSVDDVLCTKDGVYGEYMNTLTGTTLKMLNDPSGDAREQLNKVLDQMSQSIIQTMNQKYGDNFIFAGADGHNVPFEIRDNKLYYRGIPVDAAIPNVLTDKDGNPLAVSQDGKTVNPATATDPVYYLDMDNVKAITPERYDTLCDRVNIQNDDEYVLGDDGTYQPAAPGESGDFYKLADPDENGNDQYISKDAYDAAKAQLDSLLKNDDGTPYALKDENGNVVSYLAVNGEPQVMKKSDYDQQVLDYDKLQYLAKEKYFVDIGLGFQESENGKLIESSGFNASLNGINFLGWGLDEDGDPRNLYSLVQKMRTVANSVSSGTDWDDATWNEFDRLVGKFEDGVSNYQTEFVNLDASTTKLKNQEELLSDNFYNLQEQYSDLEDVDMVDAITSFIWAEYCYNAALKVGNSILSESLMDYLR